uniref:Glutathione transferase n=1 Tax=Trichobilharzia regenti TaxID=157069 RepID=A0AA85IV32_TRIRE|nr:unnamed protein product [Trichobilharzia regenti]
MVHLKNGDPEPSIDPSKYTLFAYRFCPFCERVRLTLNFHKIDYDLILVSLNDKPDWLLKYSPQGKVPLLINQGDKLLESDLIMRFVDELRGEKSALMSVCGPEVFQQAADLARKFFSPGHVILFDKTFSDSDVTRFREVCSELDQSIKNKYFAGDQLSLADLVLFPLIDHFEAILGVIHGTEPEKVHEFKLNESGSGDEAAAWPCLVKYLNTLRQESFIADSRKTSQLLAKYAATRRSGCPNPEIN